MKTLTAILLFLLIAGYTQAQYATFYKNGEAAMKNEKYYQAIKEFTAAGVCKDKPANASELLKQKINLCGEKLEKLRENAEQEKRRANDALRQAEQEKERAQRMVEALMPNEAKTDPFGFFWKKGKQSLAIFDYSQAYLQLLLAREAANKPTDMTDSVEKLFTQAEWYNTRYKKALAYFYGNQHETQYTQAKPLFEEITTKAPSDSLSLFYAKACGNPKEQDMVLVKGGSFMMGSEDEKPIHKVTLTGFHISKYEVTHAQYARFLNEFAAKNKDYPVKDSVVLFIDLEGVVSNDMKCGIYQENGIYKVLLGYENRPVAYVSWYGAEAFCRFYGLQLPTEAQWEYAARGGILGTRHGVSLKYAGSNDIDEVAWYYNNSNYRTHPVGQKQPNQLGIYDMSGNLYEWCFDGYDAYTEEEQTNPNGPESSHLRVLRGGSWNDNAVNCRLADRSINTPGNRWSSSGFRVALCLQF